MAMFDYEKRNGIQIGNVGDICNECTKKMDRDDRSKQKTLEYQEVFKYHIGNRQICLCMNCFESMLGNYALLDPTAIVEEEVVEEKPKKKSSNKKQENKEEDK